MMLRHGPIGRTRAALLASLALAGAACNRAAPPDLCAPAVAPEDAAGAEAGGDAAAVEPADASSPPQCATCADLSSGRIDQRVIAQMGSEFPLFVAAAAPGGPPVTMPGALYGVPRGALLRASVASANVDAVRSLADDVEQSLTRISNTLALTPPLAPREDPQSLRDVMGSVEVLGDACAGALALDGFVGDPGLFGRVRTAAPSLQTMLVRAAADLPRFSNDQIGAPAYLAVVGRMLASCGTLVGDPAAAVSGLDAIDAAARVQAQDGSFFDAQGRYDTGAQARVLVASIDALRSVPLSACARRLAMIESGLRWMASRVDAAGQVDSSGSASTCNPAMGALRESLDRSAVYRSLSLGSAIFEPDGAAAPLRDAAVKLSVFATMNQGASTCVP